MSRKQGIVAAIGIVLIIALYWMRSEPEKNNPIEEQRSVAYEMLDNAAKARLDRLEERIEAANDDESRGRWLKKEAQVWDSLGFEKVAALYAFRTLEYDTTLSNKIYTGERLLEAAEANRAKESEQNLTFFLYETAGQVFEDALQSDPKNSRALSGLAIVEVMSRGNVMEGVQKLLGIIREDSLNVPANLTLGRLNMVNGQYEKAVIRMQTVLKSDSLNLSALLTIANAYVAMGEDIKAIPYLEKAREAAGPQDRKEIDKKLNELKK